MGDWHARATCKDLDPNIFFPDTGRNDNADSAKRICAACPVRHLCLEDALAHPLGDCGVWGGTTVLERRTIRRRRRLSTVARSADHAAVSRPEPGVSTERGVAENNEARHVATLSHSAVDGGLGDPNLVLSGPQTRPG